MNEETTFSEQTPYKELIDTLMRDKKFIKVEGNQIFLDDEIQKQKIGNIKNIDENPAKIFEKIEQAKYFIDKKPIYYDNVGIWWDWDEEKRMWKITDEINILNQIIKKLSIDTTNTKQKTEILNALKQVAREKQPKETKKSWVQFRDIIFDLETGEKIIPTKEFFVRNPINWKIGQDEDTPKIDALFESWVGERKNELYEIIAFCMIPSYFIHRLFCFIGAGANGKSTFLKLLEKFIGKENITSSSLNLLMKERFEGSRLLNKQVCIIGETNFNLLTNTDFLKKLSGEDTIRCEFKGKNSFDFQNYAKLIMATNSLPPTADKTDGFYRRWKIIDFSNKFPKEKDVLKEIEDIEFENLSLKCLNIAKKLWVNREFSNDGNFESRKRNYEEKSNPLNKFISENYQKDINGNILFSEFFEDFNDYLEERGFRVLSSLVISKQLRNEGFETKTKTIEKNTARYILGLKASKPNNANNANNPNSYSSLTQEKNINIGYLSYLRYFNAIKDFKINIIKDEKAFELEIKKGKKYEKEDFGDNFEEIIEILVSEGVLEKNE